MYNVHSTAKSFYLYTLANWIKDSQIFENEALVVLVQEVKDLAFVENIVWYSICL